MRRSLSVSLGRVRRGDDILSAKTSRDENAIPDTLQALLTMMQVDVFSQIPGVISMANPIWTAELSQALLGVYSHENSLHIPRLLKYCLESHLKQCQNEPEQVFRGTSLETKLISIYINRECSEFVNRCITPVLEMISGLTDVLEVDPSKVKSESVSENQIILISAANLLLKMVSKHQNLIPRQVCDFFKVVRSLVEKKFYDMAEKSVASLLFLRLLNPALVAPDVHLSYQGRVPRRSLILVSKLIQNLANGVSFGEKEEYLLFANEWLHTSAPVMRDFIFDVIFAISKNEQRRLKSENFEEFLDSLRWVHNYFCFKKKEVLNGPFLDEYFHDARKKNTFVAQLRKCTNNFRPVTQESMPVEWIKELGLDRNIFQKSYTKVREGVSKRKESLLKSENENDPKISYPTLNPDFPIRKVAPTPLDVPANRVLRRGKSAGVNRRGSRLKKISSSEGNDGTVVTVQNPLTPKRVRARDEEVDLAPMELSTPALENMSPLKKVKSRESIGELSEFTPVRKTANPSRGHY